MFLNPQPPRDPLLERFVAVMVILACLSAALVLRLIPAVEVNPWLMRLAGM